MGLIYEGTSTKCGSWYFITKWTENKVEPFFYNTGVILYSLFKIKNPIYKYLSDIITMLTDQQKISFAMTNLGDQAIINMLIGMNQKISKKNVVLPLPPEFNWRQCNVILIFIFPNYLLNLPNGIDLSLYPNNTTLYI